MSDGAQVGLDLAVLVVAYRSADKLEKCLQATTTHLPLDQVYVWDNSGPSDSAVRDLVSKYPHVHWCTGSDNIGFAAAVNQLAAMVPGRDMLLLNPDALLLGPLTLTRLAIQHSAVAAAAPMVSDGVVTDRTRSLLSEQQMPWDVAHKPLTLLNAVCGLALPPERLRGTWLSDRYRSQPTEVAGYLTGACLAIRRDAWDALGPLDEEFFLYGEEAEWQSRAKAAGYNLRLADEVGVYHAANGTVAGDSSAFRRSDDLFRTGVALRLEYLHGNWAAEVFLATVSLIELVKKRVRNRRTDDPPSGVMLTLNETGDTLLTDERLATASELAAGGQKVTLVSLRRIGALPRRVPLAVRLIRRPWWWPSTAPDRTPSVLLVGTTKRERAFALLFRLRRSRVCVHSPSDLGFLPALRTSPTPIRDAD